MSTVTLTSITLGNSAYKDVGLISNTVAAGDDPRFGSGLATLKVTGSANQSYLDFYGIGGAQVFISGNQVFFSGGAGGGGTVTTGSGVSQGVVDALSGYSNNTFATITNLRTTGTTLFNIITAFSGQSNTNYATATNLGLTGGNLYSIITAASGQANTNYATATNLTTSGSTLSSIIVGLSGQANTNFATVSNLGLTGSTNYNLLTGASGILRNLISASTAGVGSINSISGAIALVQAGNVFISTNGQNIIISGSGSSVGGGITQSQLDSLSGWASSSTGQFSTERILMSGIATGLDTLFINWTPNFASIPRMVQVSVEVTGTTVYMANIKNRTISGYTVLFSDIVTESGVYIHTYARL